MRFDLHCHSRFSFDSKMEPELILETAKKAGLHAVAITDHNTIDGGVYAKKLEDYYDITVIVGQETHTDIGDVIGLFLEKNIESRRWNEVVKEIKDQKGLILLPHPLVSKAFHHDSLLKCVDLIESYNPRYTRLPETKAGKGELSVHHVAEVYNLKAVANSDSHDYDGIGLAYNEIDEDARSVTDLKTALMNSKIKIFGALSHKARRS